jgi:hypothetical protein
MQASDTHDDVARADDETNPCHLLTRWAGLAMATAPMAMIAREFDTMRGCALYLHGMGIQTNTCPEDSWGRRDAPDTRLMPPALAGCTRHDSGTGSATT